MSQPGPSVAMNKIVKYHKLVTVINIYCNTHIVSQADYRRYFDPANYRIVQMDQRGCGGYLWYNLQITLKWFSQVNQLLTLSWRTTTPRLWWRTLRNSGSSWASRNGSSSGDPGAQHSVLPTPSTTLTGRDRNTRSSLIIISFILCRVRALILRGIFMCRRSELLFFYQNGASHSK